MPKSSRQLEQENPRAAIKFGRHIETLAGLLARNPLIGRATRSSDFRVLPAKPFPDLIFYRVVRVVSPDEGIMIYRVRHMARKQDWRKGR